MAKESIMFFTRFNHAVSGNAPTGDKFDKTYEMQFDKTGHKILKESGKTNRYEKIQCHKDETLIENILKRATLDPSVLEQRIGQYGDFSKMPKSLAEFQNMAIGLEATFKSLPSDVRAKFDNSVDKFIHDAGSKEWFEIVNPKQVEKVVDKAVEAKESEVSADV